jgi:ABC-type phosphate transport system permease subunit
MVYMHQPRDRRFKWIAAILIFKVIVALVISFCFVFFGIRLIKNITDNGLKQTIERIWEGPGRQ